MTDFKDMLRIRKTNHHARCSQCLRHRAIIRRLGHCLPARRAQVAQLQRHLARQYRDRQIYWESRSMSRISASSSCPAVVTAILDSMDAAKHSWPFCQAMQSKEFASWVRPRMSSTTLLIHGFLALTVLSPHFVTCNSSRSAEIISHGMSLLMQRGYDFRATHLYLQGDNCSKELKNNCILRWASQQIANKRLGACTASFLSSGHSHEDIDALFSNFASWLQHSGPLTTPVAFVNALQKFMEVPTHRPHEKIKKVMIMSQFRDWCLNYVLLFWGFEKIRNVEQDLPKYGHTLQLYMFIYIYIFLYWVMGPSPCQHFLDSLNLLHLYISVYNRFTSFNGSDSNFKPFPRNRNHVRKNFFAEHFAYAQLLGVGGPGAPHVFYLQRLEDSGTSV